MDEIQIEVKSDENSKRLDKFICDKIEELTRSSVQKLINDGNVKVNGEKKNKNYICRSGDILNITIPEPSLIDVLPQNIPIDIMYEDDSLLIVNKSKGMVVHPAPGNYTGTLVNALLYHCGESLSGINGVIRPGIVHRIDKDTSGLLVVAKNDSSHKILVEKIKAHDFKREYEAVVYGNVKEDSGIIDEPIGRHSIDRKKMTVTHKNSKNAITYYNVINRYDGFTHIKLNLKTGRTHQIRVHMAYIGHPLAGDAVYGPKKVIKSLNGQCLHARTLGFVHPHSNNYMEFSSDLPDYFKYFLNQLNIIK